MSRDALGDDLDDGLEYQVEFSDGETVAVDDNTHNNADSSDETEKVVKQLTASKKRKAAPKSKLQEKKKMKMEMDINQKKNLSLELSPEAIADFVNTRIRRKNPDLSALELSEKYLDKTVFRASGDFKEERTLPNFAGYITAKFKNMLPGGESKKSKKAKNAAAQAGTAAAVDANADRKFIAVLSMSALRACDVHRLTRDLGGSSLKLINKNKIDVDLKLVKSTRSRVLCCTPGRLAKVLAAEDAELSADEIKIIILDNTYLDQKCQNVWDINETLDVLKTLTDAGGKVYLY